jgi:hypothetical protein
MMRTLNVAPWEKEKQEDQLEVAPWEQQSGVPEYYRLANTYEAPTPSRGLWAINDYVIEAANAILGGGKALVDFAVPGTELANQIEGLIQQGAESQSQVAQQAKQQLSQDIEAGGMQALKGVGSYVLENPLLAASQAVGSFALPGTAIKGAQAAARGLGIGQRAATAEQAAVRAGIRPYIPGAARAAGDRAVGRVGLGAGALTGAALGGGDAAGQAYDIVMQETGNEALALQAARDASIAPAAIGGLTGLIGAERLFAGLGKAGRGGRIKTATTTGLSEAAQETFEEGATQLSANLAAQQFVPELDVMKGVVGSAALGFALGGITGGGIGFITGGKPQDALQTDISTDQQTQQQQQLLTEPTQLDLFPGGLPVELAPPSQIINPYNVGGYVGAQEQGLDTSMQFQAPTGQQSFVMGQGPVEQVSTQAPARAAQPAAQQTQGAKPPQAQAPQIDPAVAQQIAQAYGVSQIPPGPGVPTQAFTIAGKTVMGVPRVNQIVSEIAQANQNKDPDRVQLESAIVASGIPISGQPSAKGILGGIDSVIKKYQLDGAATLNDAANILEFQIGQAKSPKSVEPMARIYEALTGQMSPAFQRLTEGPTTETTPLKFGLASSITTTAAPTATPTPAAGTAPLTPPASLGLMQPTGAPSGQPTPRAAAPAPATTAAPAATAAPATVQAQPVRAAQPVSPAPSPRTEEVTAGAQAWEDMNVSTVQYSDLTEQDRADWDQAVAEGRATGEAQEQLAKEYELIQEQGFMQQVLDRIIGRVIKSPNKARYYSTFLAAGAKQQDIIAKATENAERDADGNLTEKAQAQIKALSQELSALRGAPNQELAAEYGVALDTLKEWNQGLRTFLTDKAAQLQEAARVVAVELRLEGGNLRNVLSQMVVRHQQAAADFQAATQLEQTVFDQTTLADPESGMAVLEGRTAASVQEVYNASETVNARFLRLQQELVDAENDGNQELADEITAKLDALTEDAAKQASGQTAKRAPAVKKEKKDAVPKREVKETKTKHRVTFEGQPATLTIIRSIEEPNQVAGFNIKVDGERLPFVNLGKQGVYTDEKLIDSLIETEVLDAKGEPSAVPKRETEKVSVQPKARVGEKVGQKVRVAKEPAAEGETQTQKEEVKTTAVADVSKFGRLQEYLNRFKPLSTQNFQMVGSGQLTAIRKNSEFKTLENVTDGEIQAKYEVRDLPNSETKRHTLVLMGRGRNNEVFEMDFDLGTTSSKPHSLKQRRSVDGDTLMVHYPGDLESGNLIFNIFGSPRAIEARKSTQVTTTGTTKAPSTQTTQAAAVLTAQEAAEAKYNELRQLVGDALPTWDKLSDAQRAALVEIDPAQMNMRDLQRIVDDSRTIDVEAREVSGTERQLLLEQTNKLNDSQVKLLENEYGAKVGTDSFVKQLSTDVSNYVNKGAEFVSAKIRAVIKAIASGVLAVGIVFNPNIQLSNFAFDLPTVYASSKTVITEVPADAAPRMSALAQSVYVQMANAAQKSGKGFIIADKPNGMIHLFNADGSLLAQDTALYGKDVGDSIAGQKASLEGGPKVTPAGQFELGIMPSNDYAGGFGLTLQGTNQPLTSPENLAKKRFNSTVAVHAAYLGDVNERRLDRLASKSAKDNRISYGCINTSHDLFINKIKPNAKSFDGGMIFVLPDNPQFLAEKGQLPTPPAPKTPAKNAMRRRAEKHVQELTDTDQSLMLEDASLDELTSAYEGAAALQTEYNSLGLSNVFKAVGQFFISYNRNVDWDGIITTIDNQVAVVLRQDVAVKKGRMKFTMAHEIGHAVDQTVQGLNTYSSDPRLNLKKTKDSVIPLGEVAVEMAKVRKKNPDINRLLNYPFAFNEVSDLNADEIRQELFAQIWAMYTSSPITRDFIEQEAPKTAAFMKEVLANVQSTENFNATNVEGSSFDSRKEGVLSGWRGIAGETRTTAKIKKSKTAAKIISRLPKELHPQAIQIFTTIHEWAAKVAPTFAFTEDLADMASSKMKSARKFIDLFNRKKVITIEYELRVKRILDSYDKLDASERGTGPKSVNAFLKDSTMAGKWGEVPDHLKGQIQADPEYKARLKSFSPEAQAVISSVFKHGYDTLQAMKKAVRENITTEFDALIEQAKNAAKPDPAEISKLERNRDASLREYETLLKIAARTPYAPLKRFGDYVVIGKSQALIDAEENNDTKEITRLKKDAAHYYVAFAETAGEGQVITESIRGQYAKVTDAFEKSAEENLYGGSDLNQVFSRLRNMVKEDLKNEDTAANRSLNRLINNLHFSMLGQQSARHAENRRLGVAGADQDMMRAFATQGRATAHFIGSLTNTSKIYETLREMRKEAGYNPEARRYYNEFLKRHTMGFDYAPAPLLNKALATTSFWMLLTNPAYYLQNMTQPIMMSVPYMAGRFNYARTQAALFKAYPDVAKLIRQISSASEEVDFSKLPDDVRDAVIELTKRGRIDISLEQDLGDWTSSEDSKFKNVGKVVGTLRSVAQKVELINRVATAIAAYRLAITAPGANAQSAIDYADKVIRVTHGDYSGANAPRVMRSGIGRLATQFRKFQLIQISMMVRMLNDSLRNADPKERQAARWALLWTLTHAGVAGGIMGLPGFAAIAAIYGLIFGDKDEPYDPERELKAFFGDDIGLMMTKGLPAQFGVDVSGKIGMGQMLSILPYTDLDLSRDGWEATVTAAMGPFVGGLLPRAIDGLSQMNQGNYYKGIEMMMPLGVANTMKAWRVGNEGITQRNNDITLKADEITALDQMLQALGLPPTKITEQQFRTRSKIEAEQFFTQRTTELKRKYALAYRQNDSQSMQEAREAWRRMQDARASIGFKRQPLSNLLRSPQEQRKRELQTARGVQFTTQSRGFVETLPE